MGTFIDLTGQTINQLYIIKRIGTSKCGQPIWLCRCSCGKEIEVKSQILRGGQKSCRDCFNKRNKTHGLSQTKEYHTWEGMKARCGKSSNDAYKYYGGRGISVCEEWVNSFETFINDMGLAPSPKHSIERINNDKGYCKDNCKWILLKHQTRNRRTSKMLTIDGETKCIGEWGEIYKTDPNTIYERIKRGWVGRDAVTQPLIKENDYSSITINGVTKHLKEWSKEHGIRYDTVKQRISRGWSVIDALAKPIIAHGFTINNFKAA